MVKIEGIKIDVVAGPYKECNDIPYIDPIYCDGAEIISFDKNNMRNEFLFQAALVFDRIMKLYESKLLIEKKRREIQHAKNQENMGREA